jgi:hypothetical protein
VSPSKEKDLAAEQAAEPPYSVFPRHERLFYAWFPCVSAFESPVSTSIYYLALAVLERGLNTSLGNINLTITTYMVYLSSSTIDRFDLLRSSNLPSLRAHNRWRHLRQI